MARILFISLFLIIVIFVVSAVRLSDKPPSILMPVKGASRSSYNQKSFGAPRQGHTHKGVDIFAKKGTDVLSATSGLVIFTGYLSLGGKAVTVISPDFKLLYYAHLDTIIASSFSWVSAGVVIGKVGNTGNAKNTPSHLHFSISRAIPYKKYFDPVPPLNEYLDSKLYY